MKNLFRILPTQTFFVEEKVFKEVFPLSPFYLEGNIRIDKQRTKGYQSTNENEGLISLNLFEVLNIPYHPMGKIISFIPVALPVNEKSKVRG